MTNLSARPKMDRLPLVFLLATWLEQNLFLLSQKLHENNSTSLREARERRAMSRASVASERETRDGMGEDDADETVEREVDAKEGEVDAKEGEAGWDLGEDPSRAASGRDNSECRVEDLADDEECDGEDGTDDDSGEVGGEEGDAGLARAPTSASGANLAGPDPVGTSFSSKTDPLVTVAARALRVTTF